jgi:hypothetical protein
MVEATLSLNCLFQAIQVQWAFVDTWESIERVSILFVKFGKLIEVIVADAVAAFYGVQLLATSSEMEALWNVVSFWLLSFLENSNIPQCRSQVPDSNCLGV